MGGGHAARPQARAHALPSARTKAEAAAGSQATGCRRAPRRGRARPARPWGGIDLLGHGCSGAWIRRRHGSRGYSRSGRAAWPRRHPSGGWPQRPFVREVSVEERQNRASADHAGTSRAAEDGPPAVGPDEEETVQRREISRHVPQVMRRRSGRAGDLAIVAEEVMVLCSDSTMRKLTGTTRARASWSSPESPVVDSAGS